MDISKTELLAPHPNARDCNAFAPAPDLPGISPVSALKALE